VVRDLGRPAPLMPNLSADVPGGAVQVMKAARRDPGWFCWAVRHVGLIEEKSTTNKEGETKVTPAHTVTSVLVKGRHVDGHRAFVAEYLDGKSASSWAVTIADHHLDPRRVPVTQLKKMLTWSTWHPTTGDER
jgi:hypothetical protein